MSGNQYVRHYGWRCPRMIRHNSRNHPLPVPCDECYSIESLTRRTSYVVGSKRGFMGTAENVEAVVSPAGGES